MPQSILDFTPEQFEEVTQAFSDRMNGGDQLLEQQFNALAQDPKFVRRFFEVAINIGLNPNDPSVGQHVRALAVTFFLYGEALGRMEQSTSKFVN